MSEGLIFFSYAHIDKARVKPVHQIVSNLGFETWIDFDRLTAGQDWNYHITEALTKAELVILFLSHTSVSKRGYVRREINFVLDKIQEKLDSDIYIIPALLDDDAEVPQSLAKYHYISYSDPEFIENLSKAIRLTITPSNDVSSIEHTETGLQIDRSLVTENYDGTPGFSFSAEMVTLTHPEYPDLRDCTDIINGWLKDNLVRQRTETFGHNAQGRQFTFADDAFMRTDQFEAYCKSITRKSNVISLVYNLYWYGAGAAHPNHNFACFNFLLKPVCRFNNLSDLFELHSEPLLLIQERAIEKFCKGREGRPKDQSTELAPRLEEKWIKEGLSSLYEFTTFSFEDHDLVLHFAPYQIGPYAAGAHVLKIPYDDLREHMTDFSKAALGVRYKRID